MAIHLEKMMYAGWQIYFTELQENQMVKEDQDKERRHERRQDDEIRQ